MTVYRPSTTIVALDFTTLSPIDRGGAEARHPSTTQRRRAADGPQTEHKLTRKSRQIRSSKAVAMEDGHSASEQAIYEALWSAAVPTGGDGESRTVRIGYHRLAKSTQLSWVSVKANLRSLEKKLAIEVIAHEDSASRQGKGYRVYSRRLVLERRSKAGLEWVRRTRGVELLAARPAVK